MSFHSNRGTVNILLQSPIAGCISWKGQWTHSFHPREHHPWHYDQQGGKSQFGLLFAIWKLLFCLKLPPVDLDGLSKLCVLKEYTVGCEVYVLTWFTFCIFLYRGICCSCTIYYCYWLSSIYGSDFSAFCGWKATSLSSSIFRLELSRKLSVSTEDLSHYHPSLIPFPL